MPTDEPSPPNAPSDAQTASDHFWRAVGYLAFAGLGYLELYEDIAVDWYYQGACAFVAERRLSIELLRAHGGAFIGWLTRRGSS